MLAKQQVPDPGGIISGWLVRLVLILALLGALLIDIGGVAISRLGLRDEALESAREATRVVTVSGGGISTVVVQAAYAVAERGMEAKGGVVLMDDFTVFPDGRVRMTVQKQPFTVLLGRIPQLRKYLVSTATVEVKRPDY